MNGRDLSIGVAAVGSGLVGGVLFAFSSFVMPALRRVPADEGICVMQSINRRAVTPAFMTLVFATTVVSVAVGVHAVLNRDDELQAGWVGVGTVAYLAALAITGAFNVPRNDRLDSFDATTPEAAEYWPAYLSEWTAGNHVRTACCIVAAAAFTVAVRVAA